MVLKPQDWVRVSQEHWLPHQGFPPTLWGPQQSGAPGGEHIWFFPSFLLLFLPLDIFVSFLLLQTSKWWEESGSWLEVEGRQRLIPLPSSLWLQREEVAPPVKLQVQQGHFKWASWPSACRLAVDAPVVLYVWLSQNQVFPMSSMDTPNCLPKTESDSQPGNLLLPSDVSRTLLFFKK